MYCDRRNLILGSSPEVSIVMPHRTEDTPRGPESRCEAEKAATAEHCKVDVGWQSCSELTAVDRACYMQPQAT